MESGILTRYNASAGSGKTYNLTAIYLARILKNKTGYRRILAVTFTHKAAADMKRKILGKLASLAAGEVTGMEEFLIQSTGKSLETISSDARDILKNILYDYSSFSVGTIDSFFQKVLKAFTREINLQHGYSIEIDHSAILKSAVDEMLKGSADDPSLRNWLTRYSDERIEEGRSWDLKKDILGQAQEIFREKFRLLPAEEREKLVNRDLLNDYIASLKKIVSVFRSGLKHYSDECTSILDRHRVTDDMFYYGKRGGVPSFIRLMREAGDESLDPPGKTIMKVFENPPVWSGKAGPSPELRAAIDNGFDTVFKSGLTFYIDNFRIVNTAELILENIYTLGILSDILKKVHEITSEENKFLLSDAGELLFRITAGDQTPFIYEKVGTTYENYMIDEFQDTSHIQWNNFRPLISDSLAQGHGSLVVGDVKQSIYRWRNSDWSIFGRLIDEEIGKPRIRTRSLETNWRSRKNIIAFNNSVFSTLPDIADNSGKYSTEQLKIGDNFAGSAQKSPEEREGGYVSVKFLDSGDEGGFLKKSLSELPGLIESLQDRGYSGSDIGILVRRNLEGAEVLQHLLNYQSNITEEKKRKYNYKAVSSDSLLLRNSPAIDLIISLFRYLYEAENDLTKTLIIRNWLSVTGRDHEFDSLLMDENPGSVMEKMLPVGFRDHLERIRDMSLFEAVEDIISYYSLGESPGNNPFLSAFQDLVLEYSGSVAADIPGFLEWWEASGSGKSVILAEHRDSIRVMTIHKSKGLEFRIVIIPFLNWSLGHSVAPTLWLTPAQQPFNTLGLVPVKYKSLLEYSLFSDEYFSERFAAAIDNLNLLYVAFTRAVEELHAFCPYGNSRQTIATLLMQAFETDSPFSNDPPMINLGNIYNKDLKEFNFGIPADASASEESRAPGIKAGKYIVHDLVSRLKLRYHGENWLMRISDEQEKRVNYGTIMHAAFESVYTINDIPASVKRLVVDGRIQESERELIEEKMRSAISDERVREWFSPGMTVLNEPSILMQGGEMRRPDRVIISKERVTVIDFKFGEEKEEHRRQVEKYLSLIKGMGYLPVEGFLWYVDRNNIIAV